MYGPQGIQVSVVVINGIVQGTDGEVMGARNIAGVLWGEFVEGRERNEKGKNGEMRVKEVGRVEDFERMVGLRV